MHRRSRIAAMPVPADINPRIVAALYGVAASLYGAHARRREFVASGRRAMYAMAGATTVAFVTLELA